MAVFNLGSINIDLIYTLPHFPAPGETVTTTSCMRTLGGKGANQSMALAAAGSRVFLVGAMNPADDWLTEVLREGGVNLTHVQSSSEATGHAVVMVDDGGTNRILIHPGGANRTIDMDRAIAALDTSSTGDWALLQNETNGAAEFAAEARARGIKVAWNAAPLDAEATLALLPLTDLLIVNEVESRGLAAATGREASELGPEHLVITGGEAGAWYHGPGGDHFQPAHEVEPVDTTGAGDCFVGYFLASIEAGTEIHEALDLAAAAAAIQVTRPGTARAIPTRKEVLDFIGKSS